jgi:F-type H+-transporting ATPase subunit a
MSMAALRPLVTSFALALLLVASPEAGAAGDKEHHGYDPKPQNEFQDSHVHERGKGHVWEFFEHLFGTPVGAELLVINLGFHTFYLTKFMILELIAALLIIAIYVPLARSIKDGALPRGRWWNFFEVLLVFIRDTVARPSFASAGGHGHGHDAHEAHGADSHGSSGHGHGEGAAHHEEPILGSHPGDAYVPFLWTVFLFILFCNLLGMIPLMGSPTASIWVTGALAVIAYAAIHVIVIQRTGVKGLLKTMWPHLEMPPGAVFKVMGFCITLLLAVIEFVGLIIKCFVLAVRLFANMFAGHMVLGNILLFIVVVGKSFGPGAVWGGITLASLLGVVALSLLELFVAFLQAYIFTFLTALFMGMQLAHAEHH